MTVRMVNDEKYRLISTVLHPHSSIGTHAQSSGDDMNYHSCRWKEKITYRVPGVAYPADRAVQFDLTAAYEIHEGRVMEP